MRALALEHLRPNSIGVYGDVLDGRGIGVDRVMVDEGQAIPDWRAYDFLVVMGAAADVWDHDEHPWITAEVKMVREAVLAGLPYFGVCFGAQLLASAFGAHSYRGVEAELGINQVFLTAAARRDPVFRGFPPDLDVCEWHSNHFALPMGAVRLARSPRYENQAIAARGRALLAPDSELDVRFADALEPSVETTGPFERARTELLYGSRLARAGRPDEATDHISAALRAFEELGAGPWAGRAREEIVSAGGAPPDPEVNRLERLTPLELDVAFATGAGAPLDDIAHQLFLGPRSARLLQASAMAKLGVESTAELVGALGAELSPDVRLPSRRCGCRAS